MNFVKETSFYAPAEVSKRAWHAVRRWRRREATKIYLRAGPLISSTNQTETNNNGSSNGADKPNKRVVALVWIGGRSAGMGLERYRRRISRIALSAARMLM